MLLRLNGSVRQAVGMGEVLNSIVFEFRVGLMTEYDNITRTSEQRKTVLVRALLPLLKKGNFSRVSNKQTAIRRCPCFCVLSENFR